MEWTTLISEVCGLTYKTWKSECWRRQRFIVIPYRKIRLVINSSCVNACIQTSACKQNSLISSKTILLFLKIISWIFRFSWNSYFSFFLQYKQEHLQSVPERVFCVHSSWVKLSMVLLVQPSSCAAAQFSDVPDWLVNVTLLYTFCRASGHRVCMALFSTASMKITQDSCHIILLSSVNIE